MTKHCYLYVYHRRYIPSYICIILSDEGFTNTDHNFKKDPVHQMTLSLMAVWMSHCNAINL